MNSQLKGFSSLRHSEIIEGRLNSLSQRLNEDFYPKYSVDSMLNEAVDSLNAKILDIGLYESEKKEIQDNIGRWVSQIKYQKVQWEQLESELNEILNNFERLEESISEKSDIAQIEQLDAKFKNYCAYADLKALYK